MSHERVIVSIGEALLIERGAQPQAGGLAIAYAAAAAKTGHRGAAVSRIGQDAAGDDLLRLARTLGVNVDHVQTDPDLPTARQVTRSIAGRTNSTLTANAAFDNLQWDFDMVDLAQRADAVIFGQLARRGGQAKSVIKQFLLECGGGGGGAFRVFDVTNRAGENIDRSEAWTGLEFCDALVADEPALKGLMPTAGGDAQATAREILRSTSVQMVVIASRQGDHQRLRAVSRHEATEPGEATPIAQHEATVMKLIVGLLDGQDLAAAIKQAAMSA